MLITAIEDPSSKLQGMFCLTAVLRSDRKERCPFMIRLLTPQQATGLALAIAVHETDYRRLHLGLVLSEQINGTLCCLLQYFRIEALRRSHHGPSI